MLLSDVVDTLVVSAYIVGFSYWYKIQQIL